jgi:hypothetical protein
MEKNNLRLDSRYSILDAITRHLESNPVVIVSEDQLENVLKAVEFVDEKETYFRDKIRILQKDDFLLIQEKSNKDEIIIRKISSLENGYKFIHDRLTVYENMWNGCGCKINYYK